MALRPLKGLKVERYNVEKQKRREGTASKWPFDFARDKRLTIVRLGRGRYDES